MAVQYRSGGDIYGTLKIEGSLYVNGRLVVGSNVGTDIGWYYMRDNAAITSIPQTTTYYKISGVTSYYDGIIMML